MKQVLLLLSLAIAYHHTNGTLQSGREFNADAHQHVGAYRNPRFIKMFATTTTTTSTLVVTTILTCHHSSDNAGAALTSCAASKKRRKRDEFVIDEKPHIDFESKLQQQSTVNPDDGDDYERVKDGVEDHQMILNDVQNFIKPSRTISQAQITTMVNTTNPKDPEENNSIENEVATSLEGSSQPHQRNERSTSGSPRSFRLFTDWDNYGYSQGDWPFFLSKTSIITETSTTYTSTYKFTIDCQPSGFAYSNCP